MLNQSHSKGRLRHKVALITGASRGIGRATSLLCAQEGAHCILTARSQCALEELDDEVRALGGSATLVPMDLTDLLAIDRLGAEIFDRYGKLDILIGNAGSLGTLTPVSHIDPAAWEQTISVNLTANWRLLRSLDPLLRVTKIAHVIMITSSVAKSGRPYWGAYAASKAALENLMQTYALEVKKTGIRVNVLNPGATKTRMRQEAFPGEDQNKLKSPEDVADAILKLLISKDKIHNQCICL